MRGCLVIKGLFVYYHTQKSWVKAIFSQVYVHGGYGPLWGVVLEGVYRRSRHNTPPPPPNEKSILLECFLVYLFSCN